MPKSASSTPTSILTSRNSSNSRLSIPPTPTTTATARVRTRIRAKIKDQGQDQKQQQQSNSNAQQTNGGDDSNSNNNGNDIDITIGDGEMPWSDDDVVDIDVKDGSVDNVVTAGGDIAIDYDPGDDVNIGDILNDALTGAGNDTGVVNIQSANLIDNDHLGEAKVINSGDFTQKWRRQGRFCPCRGRHQGRCRWR